MNHFTHTGATHCNTLQYTATHCNILQHTTLHHSYHVTRENESRHSYKWIISLIQVQHTATHCSRLQQTATHCSTPQHTATHYLASLISCHAWERVTVLIWIIHLTHTYGHICVHTCIYTPLFGCVYSRWIEYIHICFLQMIESRHSYKWFSLTE